MEILATLRATNASKAKVWVPQKEGGGGGLPRAEKYQVTNGLKGNSKGKLGHTRCYLKAVRDQATRWQTNNNHVAKH